ncbi:class II fructose-bisphosphate aldolase [Moorella naiadis]|uniref:class II fructose-bisphosphate aldolase n=1 Tax=Moorella naiadis (nom. illeg.) TaxID=3093670 RepID=UPI003D9CB9CA
MDFVTMNDIVTQPGKQGWAVGSFITFNMEMTEAILEAATEEQSPVIMMLYLPFYLKLGKGLVPMIRALAEDIKVPVCLHLDHGQNLEQIVQAIKIGFSSVMIDGSVLPLEENIALTKKIAEVAHASGVSVEAELGHVPGGEQYLGQEKVGEQKTNPNIAARFVEETGVDALAIAVGNLQGGEVGSASIDLDCLAEIRRRVSCLLVLHGGTSLGSKEVERAVKAGIDKINYFTDLRRAYARSLLGTINGDPDNAEPEDLIFNAKEQVKKVIKGKMRVFGSSGKVF